MTTREDLKMLRLWDALVACAATLGIIITAFGVMLQILEPSEGLRRIGGMVGCALLLTILPAIIVSIWLHWLFGSKSAFA